jgi:arylsulfatase A-like enzyme
MLVIGCMVAAFAIAVIEHVILTRMYRHGTRRIGLGPGVIKAAAVVIILVTISFFRRTPPISAEYEATSAPPKDAPNIILIVLDAVRQDRLSVYGHTRETTPRIAGLAEDGAVFDAYSTATWTLPSHASLLTGLYPTENGTGHQRHLALAPENESLAEILLHSGYRTGAIVANCVWLDIDNGFWQGFNYYFVDSGPSLPPVPFLAGYFIKRFLPASPVFDYTPYLRAEAVSTRAINWIGENADDPFFLFLNYMDAHDPYLPPRPYDTMWTGGKARLNFFDPPKFFEEYSNAVNAGQKTVSEKEREFLLSQYDGEIAYMDGQVGRLLDTLKAAKLYDNTLIIVTSDHGEFFGEHNLLTHLAVPYQEVIRVPLIVKPAAGSEPAIEAPGTPVSLVHLYHAILESIGIEHQSGRKDFDIFRGETGPVMAELHSTVAHRRGHWSGDSIYCLIDKELKLLRSSNGEAELYDILKDPGEARDLSAHLSPHQTDSFERLENNLAREIEKLNASALMPQALDAARYNRIRERVKALGYIE